MGRGVGVKTWRLPVLDLYRRGDMVVYIEAPREVKMPRTLQARAEGPNGVRLYYRVAGSSDRVRFSPDIIYREPGGSRCVAAARARVDEMISAGLIAGPNTHGIRAPSSVPVTEGMEWMARRTSLNAVSAGHWPTVTNTFRAFEAHKGRTYSIADITDDVMEELIRWAFNRPRPNPSSIEGPKNLAVAVSTTYNQAQRRIKYFEPRRPAPGEEASAKVESVQLCTPITYRLSAVNEQQIRAMLGVGFEIDKSARRRQVKLEEWADFLWRCSPEIPEQAGVLRHFLVAFLTGLRPGHITQYDFRVAHHWSDKARCYIFEPSLVANANWLRDRKQRPQYMPSHPFFVEMIGLWASQGVHHVWHDVTPVPDKTMDPARIADIPHTAFRKLRFTYPEIPDLTPKNIRDTITTLMSSADFNSSSFIGHQDGSSRITQRYRHVSPEQFAGQRMLLAKRLYDVLGDVQKRSPFDLSKIVPDLAILLSEKSYVSEKTVS